MSVLREGMGGWLEGWLRVEERAGLVLRKDSSMRLAMTSLAGGKAVVEWCL